MPHDGAALERFGTELAMLSAPVPEEAEPIYCEHGTLLAQILAAAKLDDMKIKTEDAEDVKSESKEKLSQLQYRL